MSIVTTTNARHVLFRLAAGSRLPDDLLAKLRDEVVLAGWLRATATLEDVEVRIGNGSPRKIAGVLHAVSIDASIGLANGDVSCALRAVLVRETDTGLETLAGEIVSATVKAADGIAVALDDVTATREAGFFGNLTVSAPAPSSPSLPAAPAVAPAVAPAPAPPPAPAPAPAPAAAPPPPPVVAAPAPSAPVVAPPSAPISEPEVAKPRPSPTYSTQTGMGMPMRPVKPVKDEEDQICPDAGDVVEHFAFGRCEVVKSDGDRLHIRLGKDGRIKEVALEMLKVTPLPPVDGATGKHFRLDRRL